MNHILNESLKKYLIEISLKFPYQRKVWITNHYIPANRLLQVMAREGHSWLNINIVHPLKLAQFYVEKSGFSRGFLSYEAQTLLMRRLFEQAKNANELVYFYRLNNGKGFFRLLMDWLGMVQSFRKTFDTMDFSRFFNQAKGKDLIFLGKIYQKYLVEHDLYDKNMAYEIAIKSLEGKKRSTSNHYFFDPQENFSFIESAFIKTFAPQEMDLSNLTQSQKSLKDINEILDEDLQGFKSNQVSFSLSYSPWCEVRDLFERLIRKQIPWDEIEIVIPDMKVYGSIIQHFSLIKNIPVTYEGGVKVFDSKVFYALQTILDFFTNDLDQEVFLLFFKDNLMKTSIDLDYSKLEECLFFLNVGWGRRNWEDLLENQKGDESKENAFLHRFLKDLISLKFDFSESELCINSLMKKILHFLKTYIDLDGDRYSREVYFSLKAIHKGVFAGFYQSDFIRSLRLILGFLERGRLGKAGPKAGHLHVRPLFSTVYEQRQHLFFLGMNDKWVPGKKRQENLLNEQEEESLFDRSKAFQNSSTLTTKKVKKIIQYHKGTVHISCIKSVPLEVDYGLMPSVIMLWAYRKIQKSSEVTYEMMIKNLDDHSSYSVRDKSAELWLWEKNLIFDDFQQRRQKCLTSRYSGTITEYDAKVSLPSEYLSVTNVSKKSLSATSLQMMATCPFRYFLENKLRLTKRKIKIRKRSCWLDESEWGQMIHEAFFKIISFFLQKNKDQNVFDSDEVEQMVESCLYKYRKTYGVVEEKSYTYQAKMFKSQVKAFVDHEKLRKNSCPKYLELSFGRSQVEQKSPFSTDKPIPFDLGNGNVIYLSGSIDRVDECEDGSHMILDYKTGYQRNFKSDDYFCQGRHLQPFLYAKVFEKIFSQANKAHLTGYFYATMKGAFQEKLYTSFDQEMLKKTVRLLIETMEKGTFVVMKGLDGNTGVCQNCSAKMACQVYSANEVDKKFGDERNEDLIPLKDLQAVK